MEYSDTIDSPMGRLSIIVGEKGVRALLLSHESYEGETTPSSVHPLIKQARSELQEYFDGKRTIFLLPLDPQGTTFQKRTWKVLAKIPYGKTISYHEEAKRLGNPNAARAVGSANGKNPIPIIIPCHRVVAKDGTLGGYALGLAIKKKLLALEQVKK